MMFSARTKSKRSVKGISSVLLAIAGAFVVMPIAAFTYEISRANFACEQLKAATDAAVLAAARAYKDAGLSDSGTANSPAIYEPPTESDRRRAARRAALAILVRNAVLGRELRRSQYGVPADRSVSVDDAFVSLQFDGAGKRITASTVYGLEPAFPRLFGGAKVLKVSSSASVQSILDLAFVLDVSYSMVRETPVDLVRRSRRNGKLRYDIVRRNRTLASFLTADGHHSPGIPFPPQYLKSVSADLPFRPSMRAQPGQAGDFGFTDEVIHLSAEQMSRHPLFRQAVPGLLSLDDDTVTKISVEALRNNLDPAKFESSGVKAALGSVVQPAPGLRQAYIDLAMANCQVYGSMMQAVDSFLTDLNAQTDAHFGLVVYGGKASSPTFNQLRQPFTSKSNTKRFRFDFPYVGINRDQGQYDQVVSALYQPSSDANNIGMRIPRVVLYIGTDTGHGLKNAYKMLSDKANIRPEARQAIILLTDGLPVTANLPGIVVHRPTGKRACEKESYRAAQDCHDKKIAIYSIGFFHQGRNQSGQNLTRRGTKFLNKVKSIAGGDSEVYPVAGGGVSDLRRELARLLSDLSEIRLQN